MKIPIPSILLNDSSRNTAFYIKLTSYIVKREEEQGAIGWVMMPSRTIQTFAREVGIEEYKPVLDRFVNHYELILRDNKYSQGKCRKYALNPFFEDVEENTEVELPGADPFKPPHSYKVNPIRKDPLCSDDWFRTHIKPIFCSSLAAVRWLPEAEAAIDELKLQPAKRRQFKTYCFGPERFLTYKHKQKVFTSWHNAPRALRGYARMKGEPLVCLDFTNFHPALVGRYAGDEALIAACEAGRLYELVMEYCGIASRDEVKREVNRFFNSKPRAPSRVRPAFQRLFPIAYTALKNLKADNYKNANKKLNELEWQVMFPLCQLLHREVAKPNKTKVLPLHDAVYVPASIADECEELLNTHKPRRLILDRQDLSQQNQPNKKQEFILF